MSDQGSEREHAAGDGGGEERTGPEIKTGYISGVVFAPKAVQYSVVEGLAMFEGDIVLGTAEAMQAESEQVRADPDRPVRSVVISGARWRWPNRVVPWDIDPSLPNQQRVLDAIAHWQRFTDLIFPQRTAQNANQFPNWITFRPAGGCSSWVGMQGGQQFINLADGCTTGNAIHEIGHAVGLWHEQSREDRDRWIRINWNNIDPGYRHNFDQQITDGDDVGNYDYGSVMHYPRTAFTINGQTTIDPLQTVPAGVSVGQRAGLSAGDLAGVSAMYPFLRLIPGWFGWENQGGDIAVADISGNGRPDLIVFHIDNPGGENRGYLRVGRDLNELGNVTSGWSAVVPVPGWFGAEDQGGGVAVADLGGNGQPDVVVFHIDNPVGENHGYFRVGRDLNADGQAVGGWTNPVLVPGWFGSENQGGGIALADLNGNGRQDLIVFHIDNPGGENSGYYRIGRDLDANGNVTGGWTNPLRVPGWFGAEDQGGGVAVADMNRNGRPDLVVFHIDNPGGENHGYYRIGHDVTADGAVSGWSAPVMVPGWFGAENADGGVACVDLNGNGTPDMLVFHIDNPAGDNRGYYRTV